MANPQLDSLLPNISDTHLQALIQHYQLPLAAPASYVGNFGSLPSSSYQDVLMNMTSPGYWASFMNKEDINNIAAGQMPGALGYGRDPSSEQLDGY